MPMNKSFWMIVFGILSLLAAVAALLKARDVHRSVSRARRVVTPIQWGTIGIAVSVFFLFLPIYYTAHDFGDPYTIFRPILLSLNNTLRVFILDADFATIEEAVEGEADALRVCFSLLAAVLYVVAPVLTFSNVLYLFKNIIGEFKYSRINDRPCYILSELNRKSVALARSIRRDHEDAVIVFTDVFEQNDEPDYELLIEVRDLKAICLKKDITHVNILEKKGKVELFLIGDDESENVSQAVKITTELNQRGKKHDVKVFVFSRKASGAYIIDSIPYQKLLEHAQKQDFKGDYFKLRRINAVQQLVWNTVPEMNVFELAMKSEGKLAVLIAGMGSYGMEFFKMLIWFCQFEGYELKLTVVDKQPAGALESMIRRECPELLKTNRVRVEGEAYYDIEIIPGIDAETAALDELIAYQGTDERKKKMAKRLIETNLAIVAMGDDDLNIETAVHLRSIFDRVRGVVANKNLVLSNEAVQIYAVVYDEQKSGILQCNGIETEASFLVNHKDVPYHIRFIGAMSTQFDYKNVYDEKLEEDAFDRHVEWVHHHETVVKEWMEAGELDKVRAVDELDEKTKSGEFLLDEKKKYEKYEYYRMSSMATELYHREVWTHEDMKERIKCQKGGGKKTCHCENCLRKKRSEHMRWNAYMRVQGYAYQDGIRADRAKLHNDLKPWGELTPMDQEKD